jgi:N-ethylmaleimide reductase
MAPERVDYLLYHEASSMPQSALFKPVSFAGSTLKNRIVLAPLTRGRAGDERVPNELMAEYYQQRAGAGLLVSEATVISEEGNGWVGSPGIYNQAQIDGWKRITGLVHQAGTPMVLQLWHCGRASHSDFHDGALPFSASAVKLEGDQIHTPLGKKDYQTPQAMTEADIDRTIGHYRRAAAYAKQAGFDAVEIHGANGYLVNQFLDSRSNQRSDAYGGSLENRFRFFARAIEAVLDVLPPERVGVRLSPNGVFNDMGADDFRETFLFAADRLNEYQLGYLHIMDGLAFGFHERGEPMTLAEFRPRFDQLIMANCGYTQASAEAVLNDGLADLVAFGRPFITNPDLPARFEHGWPLAPSDDMREWYSSGASGYTSYPAYRGKA